MHEEFDEFLIKLDDVSVMCLHISVKSELPDGSRSLIHDAVELVSYHVTTGKQANISVLHIQYVCRATALPFSAIDIPLSAKFIEISI